MARQGIARVWLMITFSCHVVSGFEGSCLKWTYQSLAYRPLDRLLPETSWISSRSQVECLADCMSSQTCQHAEYDHKFGRCYLYSDVISSRVVKSGESPEHIVARRVLSPEVNMIYSVLVSVSCPKALFRLEIDNPFRITLVVAYWLG